MSEIQIIYKLSDYQFLNLTTLLFQTMERKLTRQEKPEDHKKYVTSAMNKIASNNFSKSEVNEGQQVQQVYAKTQLLRITSKSKYSSEQGKNNAIKLPQINKKRVSNSLKINQQVSQNPPELKQPVYAIGNFIGKNEELARNGDRNINQNGDFFKITTVKPVFRSNSRISSKQIHDQTRQNRLAPSMRNLGQNKEELLGQIEKERKRRVSTNNNRQSTLSQKNEDIVRLSSTSNKARKIQKVLKIEKNKQSPGLREWCQFLGNLDGLQLKKTSIQAYKAFVGKGNNSLLIKSIIKARPWWVLTQEVSQANLVWTQMKSQKIIESLEQGKEWIADSVKYSSEKSKLYLVGKLEKLNENTKKCIGKGFEKVLSESEKMNFMISYKEAYLYENLDIRKMQATRIRLYNHLQFHWHLSNKKALFYNMKAYYEAIGKNPFEFIPETYHVHQEEDSEWQRFIEGASQKQDLKKCKSKKLWIVKPGENSNQGCGIELADSVEEVRSIVKKKGLRSNGKPRSHIIQRYLIPLLYNRRKFDIRCYVLVTKRNGNLRAYWYEEGYVRTASKQFTLKNLKNKMIHLTNDAVQKHSEDYGKYESANKLSFTDFQKYLKDFEGGLDFFGKSYPQMTKMATDMVKASAHLLDPNLREFTFELFGLDFMIDEHFQTWLIEVNTNPCLELCCPLLARLIPSMLENAFKVAIDPLFPPPEYHKSKTSPEQLFQRNKFSLIFNSKQDKQVSLQIKKNLLQNIIQSQKDEEEQVQDMIQIIN